MKVVLVLGTAVVLVLGLGSAFTAANVMPGSTAHASPDRPVSVGEVAPKACSGIALTDNVSGSGGAGNDLVYGSGIVAGGGGDDCVVGSPGNDTIDGGPGNDVCIGGGGIDVFVNCETTYP